MSMELAGPIIAAKQAVTMQAAQFKMIKKQHDMEMSLINMLTQVAESAPAPKGQGQHVDKTA
jgi:hypothetical protein